MSKSTATLRRLLVGRAARSKRVGALLLGVGVLAHAALSASEAWLFPTPPGAAANQHAASTKTAAPSRRDMLLSGGMAISGGWMATMPMEAAHASGGSTAGKYSTIPSAKRRFFGRVRQGLYEFLQMEKPIMAGQLEDEKVMSFWAKNVIKKKGGQVNKNCFGDQCVTKEKRTSRYKDFETASDLLATAFRYDANDITRDLPQVRLIRSAHKNMEKMRKAITEGEVDEAQGLYVKIKGQLDRFTKFVELEPLSSEDYTHPWDTAPEVWCQGSFCV